MYEVELKVKYKPSQKTSLLQYLEEENYEYVSCEEQIDEYYNHPCRDFKETDEALRIRTIIDQEKYKDWSVLTYKGKNYSSTGQSRTEIESEISDGTAVKEILEKLGFVLAASVCKRRCTYRKKGIIICLDEVKDLGHYLEIEIMCQECMEKETQERLYEILEKFPLSDFTIEHETYLDMLMQQNI